MLDKFKQLKKLRDMQKKLKNETVTAEHNGTSVTMNGQMEIKDLSLNHDQDPDQLEQDVSKCLNQAMKKIRENISGNLM